MRQANFTGFPSNSPVKARVVFKLYLEVRSQLKKTDYSDNLNATSGHFEFLLGGKQVVFWQEVKANFF